MPARGWWVHTVWTVCLLVFSARAATIGFHHRDQGITHVNEISFSLTDEGTTSLCELEFDTDLSYIFSASVSCMILYDLLGAQVVIGDTYHSWTFYADIGGVVNHVGATISFNPTSDTIYNLVLCFQSACTMGDQECLVFPHSSSSSSSSSTVSSFLGSKSSPKMYSSYTLSSASSRSSNPEGFVFVLPSNPSLSSYKTDISSSSSIFSQLVFKSNSASFSSHYPRLSSTSSRSSEPEGFVFVLPSNPSLSSLKPYTASSASVSSSTPEGFIFNFGSTPTKSSSTSTVLSIFVPPYTESSSSDTNFLYASSASVSSSTPEGFVFAFASTPSQSSSSQRATTTITATTTATTATTGDAAQANGEIPSAGVGTFNGGSSTVV